MKKRLSSGFTLIELLVVITIIGILAALVLVALGNARDKAQDARIKSDIGQLRTLAEVYYDDNNTSYLGFGPCVMGLGACVGGLDVSTTALRDDIGNAGGTLSAASAATTFCLSSTYASDAGSAIRVTEAGVVTQGAGVAAC